MKEHTTIRISMDTLQELKKFKVDPGESHDRQILRILKMNSERISSQKAKATVTVSDASYHPGMAHMKEKEFVAMDTEGVPSGKEAEVPREDDSDKEEDTLTI